MQSENYSNCFGKKKQKVNPLNVSERMIQTEWYREVDTQHTQTLIHTLSPSKTLFVCLCVFHCGEGANIYCSGHWLPLTRGAAYYYWVVFLVSATLFANMFPSQCEPWRGLKGERGGGGGQEGHPKHEAPGSRPTPAALRWSHTQLVLHLRHTQRGANLLPFPAKRYTFTDRAN